MDLSALRTAVRTRMGIPSTDALHTDTNLTDLVNAALHQFEVEADWPWLEASETIATTTTVASYSVAASAMRTISVKSSSGVVLKEATLEELDWWGVPTGDPRLFALQAGTMILVPIPVTGALPTLTHRYIKTETDLSTGTDTPLVPTAFQQAIVEYAAFLAFRRAGNTNEANAALAAYNDWVIQARKRANRWSDSDGGGERPPKVAAA